MFINEKEHVVFNIFFSLRQSNRLEPLRLVFQDHEEDVTFPDGEQVY